MRTIIAGTRTIVNPIHLLRGIQELDWKPSVILCGCAHGVDELGRQYGKQNDIPVEFFPADWNQFGREAGKIRNLQMAHKAEALLAVWDGESHGTKHMIKEAHKLDLKIHIHLVPLISQVGSETITIEQALCKHDFEGFGRTGYSGVYLDTCKKCGFSQGYEKDYS